MDRNSTYYRQVKLLVRVLPIVGKETCFALKGGTAINLFVRDLPRLSVDIDLVYLPLEDRDTALKNVRAALTRIGAAIKQEIPGCEVIASHADTEALRIFVSHDGSRVKIELSPVMRGSVFPPSFMSVKPCVELEFGYAEMSVLTLPDLYAGKICAALDRQHPRDLFDIKLLLENEGISADMRRTFLVYLIGHNRPISELLAPGRKNIREVFEGEFANMTTIPVTVAELEETRETLIEALRSGLTEQEKKFLISFKAREPEWALLGLDGIEQLPAVRWKMLNLSKMPRDKHAKALKVLEETLATDK
jgi:predicted nucleotidyltransferase component of viral defense system